jgi:hypothetical protein
MVGRVTVVGLLVLAAAVSVTAPAAHAARANHVSGPNGVASVVINRGGQNYRVDYAATDYSADNVFTVVELTAVDQAGSRTYRNVLRGGDVADFETFTNRVRLP